MYIRIGKWAVWIVGKWLNCCMPRVVTMCTVNHSELYSGRQLLHWISRTTIIYCFTGMVINHVTKLGSCSLCCVGTYRFSHLVFVFRNGKTAQRDHHCCGHHQRSSRYHYHHRCCLVHRKEQVSRVLGTDGIKNGYILFWMDWNWIESD